MTEQTKLTPSYLIHSFICIALMVGVGFLPPIGGITPYGMDILGIFLGSIYGWVFVDFIWPSFFGMLMLVVVGYGTTAEVFKAGFGDSIVLNLFLTTAFFAFISKTGLMTFLANRIVSAKICVGRPWVLIASFFFIASYVAGFTNNVACTLLLWSIVYSIAKELGYKPGDKLITYLISGIVFFAVWSIALFPFLPWSQVCIGLMSNMVDFGAYSQLGWIVTGLILPILTIIGYIAIGKFIFKIDTSRFALPEARLNEMRSVKLGTSEKVGIVYLLIFLVIVIAPSFLPKTWPVIAIFSDWAIIGACALCFIGVCFMKNENGVAVNKFGDMVYQGVSWDMIILMIATVPICAAMEAGETGIMVTVMTAVTPFLSSLSPVILVVAIVLFFITVTQFAHNLILLLVFGPVLCQFVSVAGIPPIVFACIFVICLQSAMATPGASANSAMLFGNIEWIDKKDAMLMGWLFVVMMAILLIAVVLPINLLLN